MKVLWPTLFPDNMLLGSSGGDAHIHNVTYIYIHTDYNIIYVYIYILYNMYIIYILNMFMIHIRMIENLLMMPSADIFAQGQDSALHGLWHLGRFHGLGDASGAQAAEEGPGKKIMGKYRNILENGGVLMGKSWKNIGTYRKIHYKWRFLAGQIIELMVELRKLFFSATVFFCVFWGGLGGISISFCSFHYIYCFF
jgi:hypothetical protein